MDRTYLSYLAFSIAALTLCLSSGCYPRISPTGPVVKDSAAFLASAESRELNYSSRTRRTELPVLPFRLWGVDFDEEMLFELKDHPRYGMIEICHVRKRSGEWTWFALVAEHEGRQHVAVGSQSDYKLGQSFPAPVYRSGLRVERTENGKRIAYAFAFQLPNGEAIEGLVHASAKGNEPGRTQRNGSAMNHSKKSALAILDLEEFSWARPTVRIAGQPAAVRSLAPGLPYSMRLEQVAGGIAAGQTSVVDSPQPGVYELNNAPTSGRDSMKLTLVSDAQDLVVRGAGEVIDVEYRFRASAGSDGPQEMYRATARHGDVEAFDLRFSPPLPDLRYDLDGEYSGRMTAAVHGRQGYMIGSYWVRAGKTTAVTLLPTAPFWACERPTHTVIDVRADSVNTSTTISPALALGGDGAEHCFSRR